MKKIISIVLSISIASLLCACSNVEQAADTGTSTTGTPEFACPTVMSDYPTYDTVTALSKDSALVVAGQYLDSKPEIVDSDANSITYIETHVYQFQPIRILKGNCGDEDIRIALSYGIQPAGFSELAIKDTYLEPTTDDYKILFLQYDATNDRYYPTSQPYQLHAPSTDAVDDASTTFTLDTAIADLNDTFSTGASTLQELEAMISS